MSFEKKKKKATAGSWKKGHVANPEGRNGREGLAPWKIRVQQLLSKYGTVGEIKRLVDNGTLDLEHPIDGMILKNIIDSFSGEDSRLQREAFFDRLEGKPRENKTIRVITSMNDLTEEEKLALLGEG